MEFATLPAQPYEVYVRTDNASRITAIHSSAFLTDTEGWTKIDEGHGEKYHHAQGNYLPGPLRNERGICRYKLIDGAPVERTQEEISADLAALPEPEQTTEELLLETAADHEYRLCLMELGLTENDLTNDTESEVI